MRTFNAQLSLNFDGDSSSTSKESSGPVPIGDIIPILMARFEERAKSGRKPRRRLWRSPR